MSVEYKFIDTTLEIKVSGRFDFSVNKDFREISVKSSGKMLHGIVVDLGRVDYIDSSALGMLLILRDKVGETKERIRIINARPNIKKILNIASFEKLFLLS